MSKEAMKQEACPTCGEYEPRMGGCGTSPDDKRALCNRDTPPPAQHEPVATVAEVHMSRYTIEWTNGPLPEGTELYTSPQPTTDHHHHRRLVGDSRFESWYSDELDPIGKDFKDLVREAYEAGMNDRAVDK